MLPFIDKIIGLFRNSGDNQPALQDPQEQGNNPEQQGVRNVAFNPSALGAEPQMMSRVNDPDTLSMDEQRVMRYQQDTKQRSTLSDWVMGVISIWLLAVIIIIVALGRGCLHLTENIIITLLITTTANILGMAYLVLGDLFPRGEGALNAFLNKNKI